VIHYLLLFLVLSVTACRVEMKYIQNTCYTDAIELYVLYTTPFDSKELNFTQADNELSLTCTGTPNNVFLAYDWPFEEKSSPSPSPRGTDRSF